MVRRERFLAFNLSNARRFLQEPMNYFILERQYPLCLFFEHAYDKPLKIQVGTYFKINQKYFSVF